MSKAPIVLAVDTPDLQTAIAWVKSTQDHISVYKLGLEFFLTFGSEGVKAIQNETDSDIFLDLKLHDIPHTVSGAAKAVAHLAPKFLTVHASGGNAMVKAAVDAGARAIVCSPLEISAVRHEVGATPIIITPGVRPLDMVGTDDQQRTMTPQDAIAAGANLVVIGRPITQSWAQGAHAMKERAEEIGANLI